VSIVIPAYNEEDQLALCLDAIARQTVKPFEVIVVDNNSTDNTVKIARKYPFVTVLRERRQGVVHARNAGFNAARGDIIGRIDAETVLSPDWVERVQKIFTNSDVDVVTGSVGFTDTPFEAFFARVELFCRRYLARNLGRRGELFLYGGNMAIKRTVWRDIRDRLCTKREFHEDQDLAAHFAHTPYNLVFDEKLRVRVSARRVDSSPKSFYNYVMANSRTYAAHGLRGRFYMYPIEIAVIIFYLPLRLLYRAYNPDTHKLSLANIFQSARTSRISPVSDSL
jgi:Glycosyltransferases, probably involved in cell wall biogenesis